MGCLQLSPSGFSASSCVQSWNRDCVGVCEWGFFYVGMRRKYSNFAMACGQSYVLELLSPERSVFCFNLYHPSILLGPS